MSSSQISRPRSSLLIAAIIALCAAAAVLGARSLGWLEAFELVAYDACIRLRASDSPLSSRVAIVTITERDLTAYGWPITDQILARAIEAVARHAPRAIGLDVYRDGPVMPGTPDLEHVLAADPRVIAVMKYPDSGASGVLPPSVLRGTDRTGFSDILVDPGGVVRRGLMFLDDGAAVSYSFSLRLALLYLQAQGVVGQPDAKHPDRLRLGHVTIHPFEANDGAYVRADARGYQFLLDYKEAQRAFPTVELSELFAGTGDAALLRDKVVLIGYSAESVKDAFYTPFSRGHEAHPSIAGVLVHAHAASQLLRIALDADAPMSALRGWEQWSWILMCSIAGAFVPLFVRTPWRLALAALGGMLGLSALGICGFWAGLWVPLIPAVLAWVCAIAAMTTYQYYRETFDRGVLMQLFARLVSPEVAALIWRKRNEFIDGRDPRPEQLIATALFADLAGFVKVAAEKTPEALLEWMNEYMEAMAQTVICHGGIIRQYAGDQIVAFFGVPVPRMTDAEIDRDAVNAVECALAMEAALRELNQRWRSEGRTTMGVRIGIMTGPMIVGMLGTAARSDFSVEGDTVNTASRLESFDKQRLAPDAASRPARILIGESTLKRLGDRFETEHLGEIALKGKEQRISAYHVMGLRLHLAANA